MGTGDLLVIGAVGIGAYLLIRNRAGIAQAAAPNSESAAFNAQSRKADNAQFANDILKPIDALPYGGTVRKILSTTVGLLTFPGRQAYTTDGKAGVITRDGYRVASPREVKTGGMFSRGFH